MTATRSRTQIFLLHLHPGPKKYPDCSDYQTFHEQNGPIASAKRETHPPKPDASQQPENNRCPDSFLAARHCSARPSHRPQGHHAFRQQTFPPASPLRLPKESHQASCQVQGFTALAPAQEKLRQPQIRTEHISLATLSQIHLSVTCTVASTAGNRSQQQTSTVL